MLRFHSRQNLVLNPNLLPINFLVLLIIQFWSDGILYSFLSLAQSELFTGHGRPEIVGHNLRRLEGTEIFQDFLLELSHSNGSKQDCYIVFSSESNSSIRRLLSVSQYVPFFNFTHLISRVTVVRASLQYFVTKGRSGFVRLQIMTPDSSSWRWPGRKLPSTASGSI